MIEKLCHVSNVVPGSKSTLPSKADNATSESQHCSPEDSDSVSLDLVADPLGDVSASDPDISYQEQELHNKFGRLVLLHESGPKRYTSDGFWAKLDQELSSSHQKADLSRGDSLIDSVSDSKDNDAPFFTPSLHHHPYIFPYRTADVDLSMYLPEPLHVPYLWSIYQENVEPILKAVHVPTMAKVFRDARRNFDQLSTSHRALTWAIYYGAIVSLDPEDVLSTLGQSKDEALTRYRFAVQQALSQASFLTTSDITVLQALLIFLAVVRHQDESRLCWSLTGLAIHLARGMGLHRDGSHLALSPFDSELRRRLWWGLLHLDIRCAEELGTDLIVVDETFDTHMPSNLNDIDIGPELPEPPRPREGRTDMSLFLVRCETCKLSRKVIEAASTSSTVEEQKKVLVEVYQRIDQTFFKWIDKTDSLYDMALMLSRSLRAKTCFVIYQPELFPQAGKQTDLSHEARQCVYSAAVIILEHDYMLNTNSQLQQYRWLFQTFTSWNAIAYFLIESCRRPWTPLVERGWQAVHSYQEHNPSYIKSPAYDSVVWPVKRLWLRASRHRAREIARLGKNLDEASRLEHAECTTPIVFPFGDQLGSDDHMMDLFRERWNAMIRNGTGTTMPSHGRPSYPSSSIQSCGQTWDQHKTEAPCLIDTELFENTASLSGQTVCPSTASPTATPIFLPIVDWSELGNGIAGPGSDQVQAPRTDVNPQHTSLPTNYSCPPQWLEHLSNAPMGSRESETVDHDMFGDDFNWEAWAKSIQDLEQHN
ncbi:fungal specific transcription factor factor domain-containing protein [Fusarium denticulatum]|uniref:Fungal specific transcription factor factor domain-containing protein n=1 Tax=Fusarium denticulatum TaxID=48507 RepID=A0A8H5WMF4_9HYPO|nr:fungal specific transcription factor factor domain-containing protein [Fusarium denticulatum]